MDTKLSLFTDILPEERERMRICFDMRTAVFAPGEILMTYAHQMKNVGLIENGRAFLCCLDPEGNEYILEELHKDSVFGEPFLLPDDTLQYYIKAKSTTQVTFIDYFHIIKRCPNACHHHSQLVSNLLQMIALKSSQQSSRIYVLSRSTIQKKLLAYLSGLAASQHTQSVTLPMSYTDLAQYLGTDRSALRREIKHLCDQGFLQKDGRCITLISIPSVTQHPDIF